MSYYNDEIVDVGDYVKLNLVDDIYRVDGKDRDGVDLVDRSGAFTDAPYEDIERVILPSEMDYCF